MSLSWFKKKPANDPAPAQASPAAVPAAAPLDAFALDARIREAETLFSKGQLDEALEVLEPLLKAHPGDLRVLMTWGAVLYQRGDYLSAINPLLTVAQAEPKNLRAHYVLAASLGASGDHATAVQVAQRALAVSPRDVDLLLLAANSWAQLGEYQEGARLINQAIDIKPDNVAAHHRLDSMSKHSTMKRSLYELSPRVAQARQRVINRLLAAHRRKGLNADDATALITMLEASRETFPTALKVAQSCSAAQDIPAVLADSLANVFWAAGDGAQLQKLRDYCYDIDPQNVYFRLALSHAWLINGTDHWSEAWRMMTQTLHQSRPKQHPDQVPLWEGEKLGKRKVLVYQDQGVGDAIMAFRFLPLLVARGIRFDLWVSSGLADLAENIQGYENLIRSNEVPDPRAYGCDFAVPLFGLIGALNLGIEHLAKPPVMQITADRLAELRARVASLPGLRVGLMYGGNPNRRDDWERSVSREELQPLLALAGISWINLVVDERPEKAGVIEALHMMDPTGEIRNFADTSAVVSALDAVIAVDSSVAHVAGNLGKPFWVLVPSSCDWRWQIGDRVNPWWPTGRMHRSAAPGAWDSAIKAVAGEVAAFAQERAAARDSHTALAVS